MIKKSIFTLYIFCQKCCLHPYLPCWRCPGRHFRKKMLPLLYITAYPVFPINFVVYRESCRMLYSAPFFQPTGADKGRVGHHTPPPCIRPLEWEGGTIQLYSCQNHLDKNSSESKKWCFVFFSIGPLDPLASSKMGGQKSHSTRCGAIKCSINSSYPPLLRKIL